MLQENTLSADVLQVKMIEIDENGEVMTRLPKTDYEGQLNRTLLLALYPDIKVVQIQVPQMLLDKFEEKQVASRLASVTIDGRSIVWSAALVRSRTESFMRSTPSTKTSSRRDFKTGLRRRSPISVFCYRIAAFWSNILTLTF